MAPFNLNSTRISALFGGFEAAGGCFVSRVVWSLGKSGALLLFISIDRGLLSFRSLEFGWRVTETWNNWRTIHRQCVKKPECTIESPWGNLRRIWETSSLLRRCHTMGTDFEGNGLFGTGRMVGHAKGQCSWTQLKEEMTMICVGFGRSCLEGSGHTSFCNAIFFEKELSSGWWE